MPAPQENSLQNTRAEWVPSDRSTGTPRPPTDPQMHSFGDYIASYNWSGDAGVESATPTGSGDPTHHFRGAEEHDLEVNWWMQRFFVDGSGDANDPVGALINWSAGTAWPTHEVVIRREVEEGGNLGGGLREFIVGSGCKPISGAAPGDPSESQPIVAAAGYACEKVTQIVVHQPSGTVTPKVKSTAAADTGQVVTIENEGATTTDTFSLNGTTEVSGDGTESFSDIDAIRVDGTHEGDIIVTDGNGNQIVEAGETGLVGTNTDGVDADRGIPLLGSGSHAADIDQPPEDYLFLGTSTTYDGGALAESGAGDRIHSLDLTIEADDDRNAQQGTRRQAIDPGPRTATVEADLAGPYESAVQNRRYFASEQGDVVYSFPDGDVTVVAAQPTDTDDVEREGGEANLIYGISLEGNGSPSVTATHN